MGKTRGVKARALKPRAPHPPFSVALGDSLRRPNHDVDSFTEMEKWGRTFERESVRRGDRIGFDRGLRLLERPGRMMDFCAEKGALVRSSVPASLA